MTISTDKTPLSIAPQRSGGEAILRGFTRRCPACGRGALFSSYLKVIGRCSVCGEELHHHRADDASAYLTIFIVAHIVVPLVLIVERLWQPNLLTHLALWIPVALALTLLLLPAVKGAIVALQWALKLHGFEYAALARTSERPLDG